MSKQKRSSTQWMLESLSGMGESKCEHFPPEFICGLRGAVEAGLSCDQLVAVIVLFTGIYEAGERMTGSELVERATHLVCIMKGDICFRSGERDRNRKSREKKALLAKNRKSREKKALLAKKKRGI